MKTITIFNQKGGVGKTSTAFALASGLTMKGFKVLSIDLDPQTNFSYVSGINTAEAEIDVLSLFEGEETAEKAILEANQGYSIIPGTTDLSNYNGGKYELKELLEPIKKKFDYCIIDTPPALNYLSIQALKASNSIIVPIEADILSLQGLSQLNETIQAVKQDYNKSLKIEGVLLTKYDSRPNLTRNIRENISQIAKNLKTKAFDTVIRNGIHIKYAMYDQVNLFTEYPRENVTADYMALIEELIK